MTSRNRERSNSWPGKSLERNISKRLEIKTPFQRTTNRKWHMGCHMVTWPMTSRNRERSNSWPGKSLERNISKTAGDRDSVPKDYQQEMAYGVSHGHVTDDVTWPPRVLWVWGSMVGYPSDSLASCSVMRRLQQNLRSQWPPVLGVDCPHRRLHPCTCSD